MAFPTSINSQITDSITQANTELGGNSSALASGNLYQATSQSLGNAAHNATTAQQQTFLTAQATTVQGVSTLLCFDTATTEKATRAIFKSTEGVTYA
ncbi:MAG: RebB family R body protein [Desulfobacteraceae bacterium]|jgi:hypothetical protein